MVCLSMKFRNQISTWYRASLEDMNELWRDFQIMVYNLPSTQTRRPTRLCRQSHAS